MWCTLHCAIVISIETSLQFCWSYQLWVSSTKIRMRLDYFPSCSRAHWWKAIKFFIERVSHTADYNENINMHTQPHTDCSQSCSGKLQVNLKLCSTNEVWESEQRNVCGNWTDKNAIVHYEWVSGCHNFAFFFFFFPHFLISASWVLQNSGQYSMSQF